MATSDGRPMRAVVVGAGQLGRVMAEHFAAEGYAVQAFGRTLPRDLPRGVEGYAADLETPEGVSTACRSIAAGPLHALIVTAGAYAGGSLIEETAQEEFERLLWVNARLPFYLLQGLLPALRASRGSAVLIGALAAQDARPKQVSYNASKAALHSIVQTAAQELKGSSATVNALLPLTIDTPSNRSGMPGRDPAQWVAPGRLAELALFLCRESGRDVTGALIPVRGAS